MALKLHNLKPAKGAVKRKKRLGRGDSSGWGTYAGRGLKGQKSRSGGKGGLKLKGLKANIQNIPKLGGFKSLKEKMKIVNLVDLEKNFTKSDIITPAKLVEKGLIKSAKPGVKILGTGKISKALTVKVDKISASAQEAITKAGGKVILLAKGKKPAKRKEKPAEKKEKVNAIAGKEKSIVNEEKKQPQKGPKERKNNFSKFKPYT